MKPVTLREAEYRRNVWDLTVEKAVGPKALLQPAFWSHVAGRLKPRDRIEVTAADGAWFAELMVRTASRLEAKVAMMRFVDLEKADKAASELTEVEAYEVTYRGPSAKWSVKRRSDAAVMVERLETKAEAEAWVQSQGQPGQQAQAA